jgi:hypothetical protein
VAEKEDDLNHLYLSCRMSSELGAGLRYAYSRLDIIDRKASETFRSYTFIFGLLVGIRVIGGIPLLSPQGEYYLLSALIYGNFIALAGIAIWMAIEHKAISSLRFYRIPVACCDASTLPDIPATPVSLTSACATALQNYLKEISTVTMDRERRLQVLGRLYSLGLALSLIEATMMVLAVGPLRNS